MTARAADADRTLRAEQRSMSASGDGGEPPYLGATDLIIDNTLERAARVWSDL